MAEKHPGDDTSQRIEDSLVRLKGALYGVELTQRFSKDSVKNFKSYCKEFVKNVKPTGFVEPQMEMPTRASVRLRESLNAVLRSGAKSMIQMPTNSNEPKVPSSNNTLVISPVSTSGRAPRRAAMKARAGCFSAFHLPQKLRRPTNFDPKSGVLLPTIPQTPEVARKILDREIGDQDDVAGSGIVAGPSSAHDAKSGSCKRSFDEVFKIPELPVAEPKKKAERASRSRSRRLNASQAASTDPAMELAAEICRSKRVTRSRSTRSRRQEETTTEDDESEDTNPRHVEPHSRSTRARSKMLKVPDAQQQMSEPSSSTFLVEREQPMEVANDFYEEGAMTIAPPKTRNTYRVSGVDTNKQSNDEATDDLLSRTFRVNAATNKPKASKKVIKEKCRSESASPGPSRRSRSVPDMFGSNSAIDEIHHVLKKRPSNVDDPTENFDPWAELSDTDPNRGLKRPSDQGPVIKSKRSKTEDPSVGGVEGMVFEVELQAAPPRTRSKHRAQTKNAHDGAHSAFLGLKGIVNKENDRLAIGQMMKAMERPGRLTPSKTSKLAKNKRVEVLKKTEEDPSKKKKDMLSQKTEDLKQKREMKERKAAELRAAAEREKQLQLEKEQKEREEREKQARAEKQKQKEEALMKKKLLNMQKAQEAEERRRKEEELRLARLKEQEEEQRRAAEARMKQVEDAERLAALRKAQEKEEEAMRLQQEKMKEKERLNAAKMAQKSKEHVDPDDIGIADEDAEESDGKPPRCPTPKWAEKEDRTKQLKLQAFLASEAIFDFFDIKNETPDLREIFGSGALLRPRTSSAVWPTTPPPPASSRGSQMTGRSSKDEPRTSGDDNSNSLLSAVGLKSKSPSLRNLQAPGETGPQEETPETGFGSKDTSYSSLWRALTIRNNLGCDSVLGETENIVNYYKKRWQEHRCDRKSPSSRVEEVDAGSHVTLYNKMASTRPVTTPARRPLRARTEDSGKTPFHDPFSSFNDRSKVSSLSTSRVPFSTSTSTTVEKEPNFHFLRNCVSTPTLWALEKPRPVLGNFPMEETGHCEKKHTQKNRHNKSKSMKVAKKSNECHLNSKPETKFRLRADKKKRVANKENATRPSTVGSCVHSRAGSYSELLTTALGGTSPLAPNVPLFDVKTLPRRYSLGTKN